ncbi:S8 family peptidase [Streptomyces lateritius]|uniref:S8 family peptidase n=1 Tax=Streptomyces lateritius TaxID=67313 RepID=UPI0019A4B727|nr:S8 family serine peptidase [Streptomyces lateritius]GGU14739.1 extracellular protease [Streptomyces lateritius]
MYQRSALPARKIFGTALAAGLAATMLVVVPGTADAVEGSIPGAGAPLPASGAPQTDAAAPATDGPVERLIVGYKSKATEAKSNDAAAKDAEAKGKKAGETLAFERRLGTGAALVDLGAELGKKDAEDVMAAFRADPDVAYVVPDRRVYATAVQPNDTYYKRQWDLFEAAAGMNVPGAWDKATGEGVKVAVIDTGYVAHSDLAANVIAGYDFISDTRMSRDGDGPDSNPADTGDWMNMGDCGVDEFGRPVPDSDRNNSWHGTHVAGTIAATAGNGKGIAGIAHKATIQPVRVLGWCGGTDADIINAITWASGGSVQGVPANPNPADVINMSLGGGGACNPGTQSAINGAVSRGTTVVVAAGNSNKNASGFQPANCNNVITVAASDREGNRAAYSNYGSIIDVTAPGGETALSSANGIWSTLNTGIRSLGSETYAAYQGTSMAAPHIAGLAALMNQASPSMTPAQIESAIKTNARTLPGTCSGGCGAGLADAARTLGAPGGTDPQPPTGSVFTNAANVTIPDTNTPVTSSLAVTGISGNAPTALKAAVDIKHPYRGDLRIELVAPNGVATLLKATSSSDSAANVITTYTVNASSAAASGTWKLRVTDVYSGDTGYIDSWSLTF